MRETPNHRYVSHYMYFDMSMITHLICCSTWWNCVPRHPNNHSMLAINVSLFEALSNVIHPICKTISSALLLIISGHSERSSSNRNSLTLLVMLRQSVIKRNACAKCSPSWWPGTHWKPMRSACSLRVVFNPSDTDLIQCAVTAVNGVQLGSDHIHIVTDIFPTDFCGQ